MRPHRKEQLYHFELKPEKIGFTSSSGIVYNITSFDFKEHNIAVAITNPQVDDNVAAIKVWESYDHEPYMRRRCWIKEIK